MSTRRNEDALKRHLADLLVFAAILAILLICIQIGCVDLRLPFQPEEVLPTPEDLTSERVLQQLESRSRLCSAEMDVTILLSGGREHRRFLLPDGHTDVGLRVPGTVRAVVDLENIEDLSVSTSGDITTVSVRLPVPEISDTTINYGDISWHHSSDFLHLFRADSEALEIREELLAEAHRIMPERALQAGLLIEAQRNAVTVITDTARSLGGDQIEVSFMERRTSC